ncbi:M48 family metallopeptidase [uncultured Tenacibaculum sp.]|uniref:M48 family metallopeptidase n=1 Tax=uncultured Tenacibaculum sp. TaxID=174713 RepID=UPI002624481E|nr:M48 family metallopeptidase [uncultured Tenacibaculum sp.]
MKYLLFSLIFIFSINIFKIILAIIASSFYNEDIFKNINLRPKFIITEFLVLSIILSISLFILENYFISTHTIALFSIFLMSLIPSYNFIISPLKYIFSGGLHKKNKELEKVIKSKGFDYNIVIINANVVNAYATGILPFSKTILIGKNLKDNMTDESLLSIIYHEIGHLKLNHLLKHYFINILLSVASLFIFFIRNYYLDQVEHTIFEPLSIFILGLFIGLSFWYIPGKIQYKLELEADSFAAKIVGPEKFKKALIELDVLSSGGVSKGGITHPILSKRIENIYTK